MKRADQYAALPFTRIGDCVQVMLITSRETKRWVIPKGWPKPGLAAHDLAALEAFEEAGLCGKIAKKSIGSFNYDKRQDDGKLQPCQVSVYPLKVLSQHIDWPERSERKRVWVSAEEAAQMVDEKLLRRLLRAFAKDVANDGKKSPAKKTASSRGSSGKGKAKTRSARKKARADC